MQNKRDQVQAHMFLMGRLTSSMLRTDPDAPESPQGRTNRGIAIGVLIALIVSAGSFVFGLLSPGKKDSWRSEWAFVVDRETGSRYLYLDGRLRPVLNYASARLLSGPDLTPVDVGTASLDGTPHGSPVGIPGAPDSLPKAAGLSTGPWQVCTGSGGSGPGSKDAATTLAVGAAVDGEGLGATEGLLVSGPDSSLHLVWRGVRLRVDSRAGARAALGYESVAPVPVSAAFLDALSAGPDLAPPEAKGRGEAGPRLDGHTTTVGQVFQVASPGSRPRYYLLRGDGLAPLTATGAALALGDPSTREEAYAGRAATALPLGASALAGRLVPGEGESTAPVTLPAAPPRPVTAGKDEAVCVRVQPSASGPRTSVALTAAKSLGPAAEPPAEGLTPACSPVDRVTVAPGGGALVRALGAGGGKLGDTTYLVTDTGMKYRIPTPEALKSLGYGGTNPTQLPSLLLSMLPTGPDLHPNAAATGKAVTTVQRCAPLRGTARSYAPTTNARATR
ncbi:type VII secretion protein EccB [Streptomyces sp. NPDC098781]|uniref:type VII secretion protein EccB n=1 Tax=Streptomyces sp. NPDC098781 TaxID=3366097 RepID=UPI00381342E0